MGRLDEDWRKLQDLRAGKKEPFFSAERFGFVADLAKIVVSAFGILFTLFLGALIFGLVVKFLWNSVMPDIFGVKEITFYQAWCLSFLCSILFKSDSKYRR